MTCSWCGKKISRLHTLIDSKYCCAGHREQAREHLMQLTVERVREMAGRPWQPDPGATVAQMDSRAQLSDSSPGHEEVQPIQANDDLRDIPTAEVNFILSSAARSS